MSRRESIDDSMFEVAEYLREEARAFVCIGPRRYEHWQITVWSPKHHKSEGKWILRAQWMLRRDPTENAINWIKELAKQVSQEKVSEPETMAFGILRFTWEDDNDERSERVDRKSEPAPLRSDGEEEDSWDLLGEGSGSDEEDG